MNNKHVSDIEKLSNKKVVPCVRTLIESLSKDCDKMEFYTSLQLAILTLVEVKNTVESDLPSSLNEEIALVHELLHNMCVDTVTVKGSLDSVKEVARNM